MVVDLVFSLDSIITAVGMVDDVRIMISAVVASVALMMVFAKPIGQFVSEHPTVKMLALSFLVVVGMVLVAEGFDHHVPKGYVYFAMAFHLLWNCSTFDYENEVLLPVFMAAGFRGSVETKICPSAKGRLGSRVICKPILTHTRFRTIASHSS